MTGNKKKIDRVSPGFDRVDRVPGRPAGWTGSRVDPPGRPGFAGPTPEQVLPPPGPVPGPGRPGPGSTRWAGPGFKTLFQMI